MAAASPTTVPARLFRLSVGTFFIGGFLSSLVSLFVPRLTLVHRLDYAHALLIQLAFHASYLVFAVPIALAVIRLGYMRSAALGLAVMASACAFLLHAYAVNSFTLMLVALLALSAGITFLQIAANTVAAVVGDAGGASVRLTLLQAFNSLGTVSAPLIGAPFVLGAGGGWETVAPPFLFAIVLLSGLAVAYAGQRNLLAGVGEARTAGARGDWRRVFADRRLLAGAGAIFAYVGAEVTIGTLLADYLALPRTLALAPVAAGRLVSLFWGGAMLGRVAGAYVLRRVAPARLLLVAALGAAGLAIVAAGAHGLPAAAALIAIGVCDSVIYPIIYVIALPREPALATPGATMLCMAVVGGSVVPMLTGLVADRAGLPVSLLLPAACYLLIAGFARRFGGVRGRA